MRNPRTQAVISGTSKIVTGCGAVANVQGEPPLPNNKGSLEEGPFLFGNEQCLKLRGSSSSLGAPMRSIGIETN